MGEFLAPFTVDDRIVIQVEPGLALALGCLILDSQTGNKALLAMGHQLRDAVADRGRVDESKIDR